MVDATTVLHDIGHQITGTVAPVACLPRVIVFHSECLCMTACGYVCMHFFVFCAVSVPNSQISSNSSALLDYLPRTPFDVTFPPGSKRQFFNVTIVDDIFPENSEYFNADVNARPEDASRVLIGSPKQPFIKILDNVDRE